jgi:hypothetical protein
VSDTLRLNLKSPVAIAATGREVWIADAGTPALARFAPEGGEPTRVVSLPSAPTAVAATATVVVAALANDTLVAFDGDGTELWGESAGRGDWQLRAAGDAVWAWNRDSGQLVRCTKSGVESRTRMEGASFAPGRDAIYALSSDGMIATRDATGADGPSARLPDDAGPTGATVVCANALWVSVTDVLVLVNARTLEVKARLPAPEGPVAHLICDGQRLFGGSRGVFTYDPAVDARVRALPITIGSPVRGLASTGSRLWVLESAEPVVHLLDVS